MGAGGRRPRVRWAIALALLVVVLSMGLYVGYLVALPETVEDDTLGATDVLVVSEVAAVRPTSYQEPVLAVDACANRWVGDERGAWSRFVVEKAADEPCFHWNETILYPSDFVSGLFLDETQYLRARFDVRIALNDTLPAQAPPVLIGTLRFGAGLDEALAPEDGVVEFLRDLEPGQTRSVDTGWSVVSRGFGPTALQWELQAVAPPNPVPAVHPLTQELLERAADPGAYRVEFSNVSFELGSALLSFGDQFVQEQAVDGRKLVREAFQLFPLFPSVFPSNATLSLDVTTTPDTRVMALYRSPNEGDRLPVPHAVHVDPETGLERVLLGEAGGYRNDVYVLVTRSEVVLLEPVAEVVPLGVLPVVLGVSAGTIPFVGCRHLLRNDRLLGSESRRDLAVLLGAEILVVGSVAALFVWGDFQDIATWPPSLFGSFVVLAWIVVIMVSVHVMRLQDARLKLHVDRDLVTERDVSRQLRAKTRELEDFAYAVSHDLKTPVMAMRWLLADLPEPTAKRLRSDFEATVGQMRDNLDGMEAFIGDLLEIAKVGDLAASDEPVDLDREAARMAKRLAALAKQRGANVVVADDLGAWRGDPTLYGQVLANLIGNALKYGCPEPGGTVRVCVERTANEARLVVEDDGPGVPEAERERVLEMFGRASTAGSESGTGLGLSLVGKIAAAYGGTVRVDTAKGGGARFVVAFPLDRASPPQRIPDATPGPGDNAAPM